MKVEPRDKKALLIGGPIAAAIVLYVFVLSPFLSDLSRKRELIPRKERDLVEIKQLRDEYVEIQKQLQAAQEAASKRGPLLTEIENLTKRANLNTKIVSLKPQQGAQGDGFKESIVEVKLDNITLYDMVNYVYLLETATLRVRKLSFKPRYDNPKLLNATLLVSSAG
ncbi:MAG: type II secretion system protein GspM [Nitrospirota bacterium]